MPSIHVPWNLDTVPFYKSRTEATRTTASNISHSLIHRIYKSLLHTTQSWNNTIHMKSDVTCVCQSELWEGSMYNVLLSESRSISTGITYPHSSHTPNILFSLAYRQHLIIGSPAFTHTYFTGPRKVPFVYHKPGTSIDSTIDQWPPATMPHTYIGLKPAKN